MSIYILLEYNGDEEAIRKILARSLVGAYITPRVTITAAEVKAGGISYEQRKKLTVAGRQKMQGWPGQRKELDL